MDVILKVKEAIRRFSLIEYGEKVLVAVSGGVDSAVLLHALCSLRDEMSLGLCVCHLNHNMRGAESRRDLEFVKALCSRLGLPFKGKTLPAGACHEQGSSTQERARALRYAFFDDAAKKTGATKVALGHNLDDSAETVVMRLVKGSSLSGLSGIPPSRGIFVRPLILASRSEIESYARKNSIKHIVDSSNLGVKYLRNDVRLRLLPYIRRRYNPNISVTIGRTAEVLRSDDDFIEQASVGAFSAAVVALSSDTVVMDRSVLASTHRALSSRVFARAVRVLAPDVSLQCSHVDAFMTLIEGIDPGAEAVLPSGIRLLREYDILRLVALKHEKPALFNVSLKIPGKTVAGGHMIEASVLKALPAMFIGPGEAFFDLDRMKGAELTARQFLPGDAMVPFGMSGKKKLKEIFIDKKIPRRERNKIPVVCLGDDIIWAAGVRAGALFCVTRKTKKVLRLRLIPLQV